MSTPRPRLRAGLAGLAALLLGAALLPARALEVSVTNLVTDDQSAHPAPIVDPALKNPWGLSLSATSPFWVSNNGSGTATLYAVDPTTQAPTKNPLAVSILGNGSVTGQAFNPGSGFNSDRFLFVSEDGTVSGWRGALGTTAEVLATGSPDNVYTGAAFAATAGGSYLYVANFKQGHVDVLKGDFSDASLTGSFVDPTLPSGYAPYNIQNLGGTLFVTYALQDALGREAVTGAGLGIVDRFDLQGNLIGRVATGGALDAPWGLAIAPTSFGSLAGALLVGNAGDGTIRAFDLATSAALGALLETGGATLAIDGLWGLGVGNDGSGGSSDRVYFTSGPDGGTHGLFGVLTAGADTPVGSTPEPGGVWLVASALVLLRWTARRVAK